jgi:ribosomal protein S12 methylthiotransferase
VRFAEFDRVGVFRYSDEPSARSFALKDKVSPRLASSRAKKLMALQRRISKRKNKGLIGRELDVLVEGPSEDSELVMMGRHAGQAPEIDGCVYLSGAPVLPGDFCRVRISQASDYDLVGEVIESAERSEAQGPGAPSPRVGSLESSLEDAASRPEPSTLRHRPSEGRRVHLPLMGPGSRSL